MIWYDRLYVGKRIAPRAERIRKRLDSGRTDLDHYIITIARNPSDMLDIMNTSYLAQDSLRKRVPMIVALAADRAEAEELLLEITEDCVRDTGEADLRKYLQKA